MQTEINTTENRANERGERAKLNEENAKKKMRMSHKVIREALVRETKNKKDSSSNNNPTSNVSHFGELRLYSAMRSVVVIYYCYWHGRRRRRRRWCCCCWWFRLWFFICSCLAFEINLTGGMRDRARTRTRAFQLHRTMHEIKESTHKWDSHRK